MKNQSKFIITALIVCFSNIAMAKGGVEFKAEASGNNTFVLKLQNPEQETIRVSLKDLNGVTLHKEMYSQTGVNHPYNLKNLPEGRYILVVQYDDLIQMQPIKKQDDVLLIEDDSIQTILPPQIDQSAGYLDVKMIYPTNLSVYLEIKDDLGNVLYGRRVRSNGEVQKRFNLKQLESGEYQFSLDIDGPLVDHRYTEHIRLMAGQ